jgi:hypothetical protein
VHPEDLGLPHVAQLIEITRVSTKKRSGESSQGRRTFVCTQALSAPEAAFAIRERWEIENKNHHPRDATLLEDKNRCRTGDTASNLTLLRGFVLAWWRWSAPQQPAPAFLTKNQLNINRAITQLTRPIPVRAG